MIEDERWVVRTGLRESMRAEPSHFFAELLRGNLSLMNLVDSDFAMINERLAQHYKIPGVYGNQFRKVNLNRARLRRLAHAGGVDGHHNRRYDHQPDLSRQG